MSKKLTAVSLFSGCGGFDFGVQQAGVDVIWANDINPYSAAAYKSILPDVEFVLDDIANISSFPKADVLIGCYPCTGYSVGARRRWRDSKADDLRVRDMKSNENNFLFWHFLRALGRIKPRYALIENVGGMVNACDGYFLEEQMFHFRRLRYTAVQAKLLASDFGVAQARERLFMVLAHYDLKKSFKYKFPDPTHGPRGNLPAVVMRDVIWGLEEWPKGEFNEKEFHGHYLTRNRKRRWDESSFTIVAHADHVPLHPMGEPMKRVGKDAWILQGDRNRRLSWYECALLQGLPSHISTFGSLRQKHPVIGNAVPPAFGQILIKPIIEFEIGSH